MCLCGCTITSMTKINVFWNFFFIPDTYPSVTLCTKFFQKMLILVFEANRAYSCQIGLFFRVLAHCGIHHSAFMQKSSSPLDHPLTRPLFLTSQVWILFVALHYVRNLLQLSLNILWTFSRVGAKNDTNTRLSNAVNLRFPRFRSNTKHTTYRYIGISYSILFSLKKSNIHNEIKCGKSFQWMVYQGDP